jgi:hypothetical protein
MAAFRASGAMLLSAQTRFGLALALKATAVPSNFTAKRHRRNPLKSLGKNHRSKFSTAETKLHLPVAFCAGWSFLTELDELIVQRRFAEGVCARHGPLESGMRK